MEIGGGGEVGGNVGGLGFTIGGLYIGGLNWTPRKGGGGGLGRTPNFLIFKSTNSNNFSSSQ